MNFPKLKLYSKDLKPRINPHEFIVFCVWAIVNGFLLAKNGVVTTGESAKYIDQAKTFIETGRLSSSNFRFYFTEISLLSLCIKVKLGFSFVILIQLLVNLLSTFFFYNTLFFLFKTHKIAMAGAIILLINLPYQEFNTFLQTESLFYSLTLILTCYLIQIEIFSSKKISIIILCLVIIVLTRPTGLLYLPPVFLYLYLFFSKNIKPVNKILILGFCALLFFYILNIALGSGGSLDFMLPFRDERIICGVPTLPYFIEIKSTGNGNSVYGLVYYVTHNFGQFIRLVCLRTFAFFGLYRNYFSLPHNLFLILYFNVLHFLALMGIFYWLRIQKKKLSYLLSLVFLTWVTVILTCDDWHNRFYLNISPYMILLSLAFVSKLVKKQNNA